MDPEKCGAGLSGLGEVERNSRATRAALDHMTAHPWRTVKLWPSKLMHSFGRATDGPYWAFQKVAGQLTVPGAGDDKRLYLASRSYSSAFHSVLMVLFLVAVPVLWLAQDKVAGTMNVPLLPISMVLYVALVSCAFFGNPRFAFPVIPFVAMYAAGLIVMVWHSLSPHKRQNQESRPPNPVE